MKKKKIENIDKYDYENLEDFNEDILDSGIKNKDNSDDIFQRIEMLHKDYQGRSFLNDFSDFDNIFKSYFCGLQKTDNENRRS